ncbi:mCG147771, partial [Mus musculus]
MKLLEHSINTLKDRDYLFFLGLWKIFLKGLCDSQAQLRIDVRDPSCVPGNKLVPPLTSPHFLTCFIFV